MVEMSSVTLVIDEVLRLERSAAGCIQVGHADSAELLECVGDDISGAAIPVTTIHRDLD